ncbi:DUF6361 family protein [Tessaracoccus antarcticus]|uniref:Uncharacterized protein n=1 Tax=Tessaracoccus antarcticus TaxID=2479848 RepID=A0A3M0G9Q8_9ACTN|nr:DUF6361 family protein [Tessaracoccus antarcticus]RMB61705.1 hypothetical protein EAX62_03505 [Tessaracoccus antarcticus]
MPSTIAWLDTSSEEQLRTRELIALFTEKDTLDELGIGQIRDVFSNVLFPGTSVIQTRARYLLLVPWAYLDAAQKRSNGTVREKAQANQRQTIEALLQLGREGHPQEGIVGARAGAGVKTLPSDIYWNALRTYGILQRELSADDLGRRPSADTESDELAGRPVTEWHPAIRVPKGFPALIPGGLELTYEEAAFLRERILQGVPGSLLAHLIGSDEPPDPDSRQPWDDSVAARVDGALAEAMTHARLFSHSIHGASLLYAVLVAEAYRDAGYNAVGDQREMTRDALRQWWEATEPLTGRLSAWDLDEFWAFVIERNPRISILTRRFVTEWLAAVKDGTAQFAADDDRLRRLIRDREREMKRSQARLSNRKLLGLWGGFTGGSGLSYRWSTVKTIVSDIHRGLERKG